MSGLHCEYSQRKDLDASRRKKHEVAVQNVTECIQAMVNPFRTESSELVNMCSGVIASPGCEEDLVNAGKIGEAAFQNFIKDCLVSNKASFHDKMKMQKPSTFSTQSKVKDKKSSREGGIMSDRRLFARMLVISHSRNVDLRSVLSYSLGPVSYSLASADGQSIMKNKSTLLGHIESLYPCQVDTVVPTLVSIHDWT